MLNTKQYLQNMEMPPELEKPYNRVVLAGMKVMFSKDTHEMALQALQGDGPLSERIATGIAQLMGILVQQSNGTLPGEVIIPAGLNLLLQACDFIDRKGIEPIDENVIAEAMASFIAKVFEGSDAPLEQVIQALEQRFGQQQQPQGV